MIEARRLTKRHGPRVAVDSLTFRVQPGVVTGILGPNRIELLQLTLESRAPERNGATTRLRLGDSPHAKQRAAAVGARPRWWSTEHVRARRKI